MSSLPIPRITVEEYLRIDRAAEVKSEFHDGELFPIEAVSLAHATLAASATGILIFNLRQSACRVVVQPLRLLVRPTKFVYPDLMIICGRPELTDEFQDTITNPKVIVEVLSPSTADYDYGAKFQLYRNLSSLDEYVLIAQNEPRVEVFRRVEGSDWLLSTYSGLNAAAPVKCLELSLPLAELYANVEFPAES